MKAIRSVDDGWSWTDEPQTWRAVLQPIINAVVALPRPASLQSLCLYMSLSCPW